MFINVLMRDDNFEVSGVKDCLAAAAPVYHLFGAETNLVAQHPDTGHSFPAAVRRAAYEWLGREMRPSPGNLAR